MENITKDQSSLRGSELKSNLDQEIEGGTKENDSISTFPFLDLLEEVQYKFLKDYLSEEETKIARLVCHDWNLTCSNKLKLNPPPANDITFRMLQHTSFKFDKLTVTDLTDNSSVEHEEIGKFVNVIVLKFKNAHISVENLEWLLKECVNVEEIHIIQSDLLTADENSHPCDQFMISKIYRCTHLSQKLRKLKIYAWYDQRVCTKELVVDCKLLSTCKKLEQFIVYSLNPFILVNPTFLPESIEILHVVLFSKKHTFSKFYNTSISPFCSHISNQAPPVIVGLELEMVLGDAVLEIASYHPIFDGHTHLVCGGCCSIRRNFEILGQTLPNVLSILGYTEETEDESIATICTQLVQFKYLDYPFSADNPQYIKRSKLLTPLGCVLLISVVILIHVYYYVI